MTLSELQTAVLRFDQERGWDAVDPTHTLLHLQEELGEVSREWLKREAYKEGSDALDQELCDLLVLCIKLANQAGLDLAVALPQKLQDLQNRFPLEESRQAMQRYLKAK